MLLLDWMLAMWSSWLNQVTGWRLIQGMYILYQLIIFFNKVRMLETDIFEIACVCFHVVICLLFYLFFI